MLSSPKENANANEKIWMQMKEIPIGEDDIFYVKTTFFVCIFDFSWYAINFCNVFSYKYVIRVIIHCFKIIRKHFKQMNRDWTKTELNSPN